MFDEHSFAEVCKRRVLHGTNLHTLQVKIETHKLEISRTQAPLLPKNDPIHPLTGQRVVVVSGHFKKVSTATSEKSEMLPWSWNSLLCWLGPRCCANVLSCTT
jgi:hypothetical protein